MKEILRSLRKEVFKPVVPVALGTITFAGALLDFGITKGNASMDADKVFLPNASAEMLANARQEIRDFDRLIIDYAHTGAININISQIPRQPEAMRALDLINQEREISQKREELYASLANKSDKRQLATLGSGITLILLGIFWRILQKPRRNENTVLAEPAES